MEYDSDIDKIHDELLKQYPIFDLLEFNDINVQEKLQKNAYLIMDYNRLYLEELSRLEDLEEKLDALIGQRYNYYRFECDKEYDKTEIKNYCIPSDKKIRQLKRIIKKRKAIVDFFEMCLKGLEKQGWNMKTFSDNMKKGF